MANYYAAARSNYFRVKNEEEFKKEMALMPDIEVVDKTHPDGSTTYALLCEADGGWPCFYYDEDSDDAVDFDIAEVIAKHLTQDSIAVFQETGAEKLRYLSGHSTAVTHLGKIVTVHIDDIYDKARKSFGTKVEITQATY